MTDTTSHKRSTVRKTLYLLIFFAFLLLIAELIAARYYYYRYGKRKLASMELYSAATTNMKTAWNKKKEVEFYHKAQEIVRPDSTPEMCHAVYDETINSNFYVYDSWLGFKRIDFNGKYIHSTGFERRSIPSIVSKETDTLQLWFIGGSTTFGFNVTDEEAIPSQFAKLYQQSQTAGKSIEVHNFGMPFYFSYQELKLFFHLLTEKGVPDIVIFIDGLNDFENHRNNVSQKHFFTIELDEFMKKYTPDFKKGTTVNSQDLPLDSVKKILVKNYLTTVEKIEQLAANYQIQSFFVIQPVPFYNYPQQQTDPICAKEEQPIFKYAYPLLDSVFKQQQNKLYLGDMLVNVSKQPFVDGYHYSPHFNKEIANRILQKIQPLLTQSK